MHIAGFPSVMLAVKTTVSVVSFKLSCVAILALLEEDSERGTSFPTGQWVDKAITD